MANCSGNGTDFITAVESLPSELTDFNFTVEAIAPYLWQYIGLNQSEMLRFENLSSFVVQPLTQERYFDYQLANIGDGWVFCHLKHLKSLHLNMKLFNISNSSVACLQRLETFDLSFTRRFTERGIRDIFSSLNSTFLKRLLLKNIQTFESNALTRFVFHELLPYTVPFRNTLEEIDISFNALAGMGPGLSLIPNLKKVDMRGNHFLGKYATDFYSKIAYIEVFLHPSLEEVYGSFQGFYDPVQKRSVATPDSNERNTKGSINCVEEPWDFGSLLANRSLICNVLYCLIPNIDQKLIPFCKQPPDSPTQPVDPKCYLGIPLPLGRHFRKLFLSSIGSRSVGDSPSMYESTICFNPENSAELIDFSNNKLARFLETPDIINRVNVTGLQKLRELNLEDNQLQLANPYFLNEFPILEVLKIGGNQIVLNESHGSFLKNKPKLQTLDMSRSDISRIPELEFIYLKSLQNLNLSENLLEVLNFTLANSTTVSFLDFSNNQISSLTSSFTHMLLSRTPKASIDLSNNPLVCNCKTIDFVEFVQSGILKFYNKEGLSCYHPTLGLVSLLSVDTGVLRKSCNSYLQIIEYVGITLSVVLVAFLLFLTYRMRWRIRYFLYRKFNAPGNYNRLYDEEFEYDAFIVYSSADKNWVHNRLQEEIEENRGHKLFLYLREILPYELLLDRLDQKMSECRKVILVLSAEFLKSEHCLYDALMAHTRLQQEGRDVVILVKLKGLPVAGIPQMITRMLTTSKCLEWTEDRYGQRLFWDMLEKELMTPPQNPMRQ